MKALTICQPYAHLIMIGEKRVENREWSTRYRGPLLIHAGKSREWLGTHEAIKVPMVFGAAVATANLVDCVPIHEIMAGVHDSAHPWLRTHAHAEGSWCLILADIRPLPVPVPMSGKQGLFTVDPEVVPALLPSCRECGCTQLHPCRGGCHWVEPDRCSGCGEVA